MRGLTAAGPSVPLAAAADYVPAVQHTVASQRQSIDGGRMDGFSLNPSCTGSALANCYSQYDPLSGPCGTESGSCIPNVAALATTYTVSDRTFEYATTPSFGGHMVFAAGGTGGFTGDNPVPPATPGAPQPLAVGPGWGCDSGYSAPFGATGTTGVLVPACIPDASGSLGPNWAGYHGLTAPYARTIFDELDAAGRSWRIYGGAGTAGKGKGFVLNGWQWAVCPYFSECLYGAQHNDVQPSTAIETDASAGQLPAFSLVTPTATDSQHNNYLMSQGDNWIGRVLSALMASPQWSSTAVFLTWDDCGCMYDHVNPLAYGASWGIRVPMVIISPWAKAGYTDHHATTFAGILAFAEHTFGLAPLTSADGSAYNYPGRLLPGRRDRVRPGGRRPGVHGRPARAGHDP